VQAKIHRVIYMKRNYSGTPPTTEKGGGGEGRVFGNFTAAGVQKGTQTNGQDTFHSEREESISGRDIAEK